MDIKPWHFQTSKTQTVTPLGGRIVYLYDGQGRTRATIWENSVTKYTWHTCGTGGENAESENIQDAKDAVIAAIVRQGWAPGGWEVAW